MFDGFRLDFIDVGEATLRVRHGGSGPPIVLLHGHPRTHVTWHKVAPELAREYTVVCPDLRGYGRSSKPPAPSLLPLSRITFIVEKSDPRSMASSMHAVRGTPWNAT